MTWKFGAFTVDTQRHVVTRDGVPLAMTPKAFDLLVLFVDNAGAVLSKQFLLDTLWADTTVDINNLNQQIAAVRKVLDDADRTIIETVPRVGFRFNMPAARPLENAPAPQSNRRALVMMIVAAFVVVLPIGSWLLRHTPKASGPMRSIAVLPFHSESVSADDSYLGFALSDALSERIRKTGSVSVRPPSAISRYSDRIVDPRKAGRELQVDAVVTGSIAKSAAAVTARLKIVRVADGEQLWSGEYSTTPAHLFTLPDDLFRSFAPAIGVRETIAPRLAYVPDPAAFRAYLEGRYYWNRRTTPDFQRAIVAYRRAIAIDPNYAAAWAALADVLGFAAQPVESTLAHARAAQLDDTLAENHAGLALASLVGDFNLMRARVEFERAIELDPTDPTSHHWFAYYFVAIGDLASALRELDTAQHADPSSLIIQTDVGNVLLRFRRYDEAIAQLERVVRTDPTFAQAHLNLGVAYGLTGRHEASIEHLRRGADLDPGPARQASLAWALALAGRRKEAASVIDAAEKTPRAAIYFAYAHAANGDKEKAIEFFTRAFENRNPEVALLNADPQLDPIRDDPRFEFIASRIRQ